MSGLQMLSLRTMLAEPTGLEAATSNGAERKQR
jgi:hypothetical protein